MSGETPNLGLQYIDPSQAQPEVKVNDAWDKIDASALGGVAVSDLSSPPIVSRVRELKFMGATVTHETGGVALVQIDSSSGGGGSGGGGSAIDVTDGITTVAAVTEINFTSGATVTASGSSAHVAISGGGGGGSAFNLTPDQHTGTPTFAENDEFEEAAGTAIDTAGTRFAGAVAWTWGNQGTSTAIQSGDGNLILTGQADGNYHGVYQPVPGGAWKRRCRVSLMNQISSAGDLASIFALNSSNGHIVGFGPFANGPGLLLIKFNSWTSFNSTGYSALPRNFTSQMLVTPTWYEMRSDGTTLTFAVSVSGAEGSFIDVTTEAIATFLGAVDNAGLSISTNSVPASALITDLWRKY
jgi:hypothetical protein